MKISNKSDNSNLREAYLKKQQERDAWFKIVVKIIRWKDNYFQKVDNSLTSKISPEEWRVYRKQVLKISTTKGKAKITDDLNELESIIRTRDGFE